MVEATKSAFVRYLRTSLVQRTGKGPGRRGVYIRIRLCQVFGYIKFIIPGRLQIVKCVPFKSNFAQIQVKGTLARGEW